MSGTAACDTDIRVAMDVEADGQGRVVATVTLDRAAAGAVGDLSDQLRVDDLEDAGWTVEGPEPTDDGGVEITAERPFAGPQGAARAIEELSGADGPFRNFVIERDASFLRTRTRFRGRVDLAAGLDAFGDEDLAARLGAPLGVEGEALRRQLGAAADEVFGFEVVVRLPGSVESNAPTSVSNGAQWRPKLGEDAVLVASAEQWNVASIAFAALAALTGVAAVALLVRTGRRRRRGRHYARG